ncbi:amino acid ABC transporter substrate-binding protein [Bradyrhizobium sp. ISRA443]|uniref:amino acid ABC transporter substrate-binding protein n=1 Tax=unclassified Bradyrhizobium TaxID=2631580 RepID=UPI00247965F5|nr:MULTISPECIES: amino acid ABC transporter substrate-binding protein [unclassified Bradyrhizobium]WGR91991.1 amino acid ABC transporter substrate-binding protein [Bradyrhizobium sp. ISRA435]WGS02407.1 amino acid ABC transporter substrate-binding protein [Bradyrhizobium sp. ISRA436]WGS09292.1 amino acid ABC transporter substrate-binding protein [Bradyrhizobium sp. ISRA437]WGS16181.1 amino acid ABC transporter substrate-binding protein [Bradyrhizobium sp. ISRA443]
MRLPAVLFVVSLAACPATAEELSGTLQKIKETKKITLGYQEASVPFSYLDGNQRPVGFALDICLRIVDAVKKDLGMPDIAVDYLPVTSSNRIPLMVNGTIDLHCSATTNSADRQKQVTFTNTHFLSATRFAAKKSHNINTIDDLKGKAVTAVAGSVNLAQLIKVNAERKLGVSILPAKDQAEAFLLLETDRVEAYLLDDVQLAVAIARSKEPAAYMISTETFSKPEPYGIMLRREDAPFKAIADRATAELYRSPEIEVMYKKWLESPTPPNGINYNVPMSPALRNAFANPNSSFDPDVYADAK